MAVIFAVGACATVAQVVALREVMVVLAGNELSVAVSLAAWLVGVGLGASLGAGLVKRRVPAAALVAAAIALLVLTAPAAIVFVRHVHQVFDVSSGRVVPPLEALLLCVLALTPTSFGVGLSFAPLVGVLWAARQRSPAAMVYALEAAGAFVGGLVFTLVLAGRVTSLVTVVAAAVGLVATAAVAARRRRRLAVGLGCLAAAGAVSFVTGGVFQLERWSNAVRWEATGEVGRRIAQMESPYQRLELAWDAGQLNLYANGSPIESFPDPWERIAPVHLALIQSASPPERVLLIGGGVADRVRAALAHGPSRVDYVGHDPAEIAIVRPYLPERDRQVLRDRRVRVINDDGRRFVAEAEPGSYDVIVVETPDPLTALTNRFYTREFHQSCARALGRRGVLAARVGTSVDYSHDDVGAPAAVLFQSLDRVFGHVALWPGGTMRMYASSVAGEVTDDPAELAARWRRRAPETGAFTDGRIEALFRQEAAERARRRLDSIEALPNRDARPVAYLYGLVLWDQRARGAEEPSPLWGLRQVGQWWLAAALALLVIGRAIWRRRRATDGLWATATGGLTGLSLEVMLLFIFQTKVGSLYASIGLLVALFMVGLTLGTLTSEWWCGRGDPRRVGAGVDLGTIVLIGVTPLVASTGAAAAWLAPFCLAVAGFCTGATFPPAVVDLRCGRGRGEDHAAGLADAADHLGACLGALTVGLVVLPVAGLWGAAAALAVVKAASLVGWMRRSVAADG